MKTLWNVFGLLALGLLGGRGWANSPEAPLPTLDTVIKRAVARAQQELENDAAFKANYSYKRSKTTEYRNIRGNLTKRKEKSSLNEPSTRQVEENTENGLRTAAATTNAISTEAAQHKRDLLANTNLVKRFTFELQGREMVDGRPTLVVNFQPKREKLPAADFKERCLSKVAGRVWLDENEFAIVKAEARLTESIGVVGGLIGSVHKFNFSFGRERTDDGLWYTRLLTWHLEMREVIVERVIDCVETKTEVRKGNDAFP